MCKRKRERESKCPPKKTLSPKLEAPKVVEVKSKNFKDKKLNGIKRTYSGFLPSLFSSQQSVFLFLPFNLNICCLMFLFVARFLDNSLCALKVTFLFIRPS